ncbi:MAG: cysteine desulfurase DndA [Kiritimatiellae bacterium]|nr:cysteine desulfurase DndA [Kiritimatiellia bacterium]MDD5519512.1 cysteine desulfurase DndA [Kiritimatiellia bacterium]
MSIYLDCNATTPLEPRVREVMLRYFDVDYGNAGSRTHDFGNRAKSAVQKARDQVAAVVDAEREEVIFTSGATESNNLALLGLAEYGEKVGRKHIISTQIEHKAVLEPLEALRQRGFNVTLVAPSEGGWVSPEAIREVIRPDTLLVSVMHVNNETGVLQPIAKIVEVLKEHVAFFHVDAAQGFGKIISDLQNKRIDLISASAHKIYGPKGVGALIARRRQFKRPPLTALLFGGGQERGLRPGTLPVPLIVGLGMASELALEDHVIRAKQCQSVREKALVAFASMKPSLNGDQSRVLPNVLNISFCGIDSEAVMVALKDLVAISNGSACTSSSYQPSHVLKAMGLCGEKISSALRISWCHLTPDVDWTQVARAITELSVH